MVPPPLGIDVAKNDFKVRLLLADDANNRARKKTFQNNRAGFEELRRWLSAQGQTQVWVCMEHTGPYWKRLVSFLHEDGHLVSVVRPDKPRSYAKSGDRRGKSDDLDALNLAEFCRDKKPRLWQPPTKAQAELRELERRRQMLVEERTREVNRLEEEPVNRVVFESIHEHLEFLDAQIERMETAINELIATDVGLKEVEKIWDSVPGIGTTTAHTLVAELGDCSQFDSFRALRKYFGLDTPKNQSGICLNGRQRISRQGRRRLRAALFMPAKAAVRHNPRIRAFAERLIAKGKPYFVWMCAVMNKLLKIGFACVKAQCMYEDAYHSATA